MNDVTTNIPLHVVDAGDRSPFAWIPVSQVAEVRQLLDKHGIRYWVSENALSINESPFVTRIHFTHGADPAAVQAILDSAV